MFSMLVQTLTSTKLMHDVSGSPRFLLRRFVATSTAMGMWITPVLAREAADQTVARRISAMGTVLEIVVTANDHRAALGATEAAAVTK